MQRPLELLNQDPNFNPVVLCSDNLPANEKNLVETIDSLGTEKNCCLDLKHAMTCITQELLGLEACHDLHYAGAADVYYYYYC
jgi:hypothetical protein